jgi:hypothetical protein
MRRITIDIYENEPTGFYHLIINGGSITDVDEDHLTVHGIQSVVKAAISEAIETF